MRDRKARPDSKFQTFYDPVTDDYNYKIRVRDEIHAHDVYGKKW